MTERFKTTGGTRLVPDILAFATCTVALCIEVLIKIDWADKVAVAQVDTRGELHDLCYARTLKIRTTEF